MLRNVLFLTLLALCLGQDQTVESDDDLSKLLEDIFGPASSTASTPKKEVITSSCRTATGANGRCVPSGSCISDSGANSVNDGKCANNEEICCHLNEVGEKCGKGNPNGQSTRILANTDANFAEYPWIVAVLHLVPTNQSGGGKLAVFTCSGSLIHPRVVMTTAHSVLKLSNLRIRAGEWDTTSTDEILPHQERNVDRIVIHDKYNTTRGNLYNDIALLILDKPLEMQMNVKVVCLPSDPQPPSANTRCYSSGWGKSNFGKEGTFQTIPKKVELPLVDRLDCQGTLRKTRLGPFFKLHSSFLCAGGERGKDTCTGDGGSPLMCPVPEESGRYMASGMVSWGIGCGDNNPGVYVDVAYLKPWVDSKMQELGFSTKFYTI